MALEPSRGALLLIQIDGSRFRRASMIFKKEKVAGYRRLAVALPRGGGLVLVTFAALRI
jgi:hypothetical protein